jgi:putative flippase GtrA
VFNTLFDLSILNLLVFFGHLPPLVANLISASISMTVSYFLNHHIVFRHTEGHSLKKFVRFFAVTGIGILGIQTLVIYLVTHFVGPHEASLTHTLRQLGFRHITGRLVDLNIAKLLAVLVAMTWNFMIYHFVIFKKPDQELDEDTLL